MIRNISALDVELMISLFDKSGTRVISLNDFTQELQPQVWLIKMWDESPFANFKMPAFCQPYIEQVYFVPNYLAIILD